MGLNKLSAPYNYKKDPNTSIVNVRPSNSKACLVRISAAEIKSKRVAAYRYLLP